MHQTVATGTIVCGHSILPIRTILKQVLAKRVWMRVRNLKIFKLSFAAIVNHFAVYHPNITGTAHWTHCVSVWVAGVKRGVLGGWRGEAEGILGIECSALYSLGAHSPD